MNHSEENPTSVKKKHPAIQGTRRIISGTKSKVYSLQVEKSRREIGGDLRECASHDLMQRHDTTVTVDEMRKIRG